ncbi:P52 family lipoprotein [Borreliella carolinensis]|uniref:P52 family lipoprotein n=1 Tax=Borreliella carolinensis TaxID=478174 RepID=A0ACD5GL61_9SPIR
MYSYIRELYSPDIKYSDEHSHEYNVVVSSPTID